MEERTKLLKALADVTRLKIVQCLLGGEQCACSIVPSMGKAQPTVSRHLKILEDAQVLESRREGINIWYKIKSRDAIKIMLILGVKKTNSKRGC